MTLIEDHQLLITSSLDCTVRVWTYAGHYVGMTTYCSLSLAYLLLLLVYCYNCCCSNYNKMLMRAATVVQVLHGLFHVLLQLLVVAAIILSFIVSFIASFIVVVISP